MRRTAIVSFFGLTRHVHNRSPSPPRNKNLLVYLLAHSITSANIYSLLPHIDRFVFTRAEGTRAAFHHFLRFLGRSPSDSAEMRSGWTEFENEAPRFSYLTYHDGRLDRTFANGQPTDGVGDRLRGKMLKILNSYVGSERSAFLISFYDFIFANLSLEYLDPNDFSLKIRSARRVRPIQANVVDFVVSVTDRESGTPPKASVFLFLVLSKAFSIPSIYVCNRHFMPAALAKFQALQSDAWKKHAQRVRELQKTDRTTKELKKKKGDRASRAP
jgi:hypothetical protein